MKKMKRILKQYSIKQTKAIILASILITAATANNVLRTTQFFYPTECPKHCKICEKSTLQCRECEEGFFKFSPTYCKKCPRTCKSCSSSSVCTKCLSGYKLMGDLCEINWISPQFLALIVLAVLLVILLCFLNVKLISRYRKKRRMISTSENTSETSNQSNQEDYKIGFYQSRKKKSKIRKDATKSFFQDRNSLSQGLMTTGIQETTERSDAKSVVYEKLGASGVGAPGQNSHLEDDLDQLEHQRKQSTGAFSFGRTAKSRKVSMAELAEEQRRQKKLREDLEYGPSNFVVLEEHKPPDTYIKIIQENKNKKRRSSKGRLKGIQEEPDIYNFAANAQYLKVGSSGWTSFSKAPSRSKGGNTVYESAQEDLSHVDNLSEFVDDLQSRTPKKSQKSSFVTVTPRNEKMSSMIPQASTPNTQRGTTKRGPESSNSVYKSDFGGTFVSVEEVSAGNQVWDHFVDEVVRGAQGEIESPSKMKSTFK